MSKRFKYRRVKRSLISNLVPHKNVMNKSGASSTSPKKTKPKFVILPFVWRGLKRICMTLGFFVLLTSLLGVMTTFSALKGKAPIKLPEEIVLFLELDGEYPETQNMGSFLDPFGAENPTIHELISTLDDATQDERVQGLYARMKSPVIGLSHLQELRDALVRFKSTGKFAHIYGTSFGDGGGMGAYYLASIFDQIWMQPVGTVSIMGLQAEIPFTGDVLNKLGITPQFLQRKEYKSAYESFTRNDISPENKEMMTALLSDMRDQIFNEISVNRNMEIAQFSSLVDKGLFPGVEALRVGLIDMLDYADVLVGNIAEGYTGDRDDLEGVFVPLLNYADNRDRKLTKDKISATTKKKRVALVHVNGAIMPSSMGGKTVAAADEIAPAIVEAMRDDTIEAIIVRVDSPGGSPTASETILRAIMRAQERGKTVIVSMGTAAASGGYWVATSADRIFAMPGTITGSIGVLGGKVSLQELWSNIGVNWATIGYGENAGMFSINTPFSDTEKQRMDMMLDDIYDGFVDRVVRGRDMSPEEVERIAKGRVWSGKRALEIGLVDELGGLTDVLDYTADLLGVEDADSLRIVTLPREKTSFEQLLELVGQEGMIYGAVDWIFSVVEMIQIQISHATSSALVYAPLKLR